MAETTVTVSSERTAVRPSAIADRRKRDHFFYTGMAFAISVGVFGGFMRTYYARTYFHSPAIPFWVHVHGAVFTAWILFYVLQNLLVLNGGIRLHRRLGIVGAILAVGVVLLGSLVALRAARQGRFFPAPDAASLLGVSFAQMLLFAVFVSAGLLLRRNGETHKRCILMATQLFFFPAFGRLLGGLNAVTLSLAMCFYLAGPIYDLISRRRLHAAYQWGVPLLVLTMPPFTVMASRAPLWHSIVGWMVK